MSLTLDDIKISEEYANLVPSLTDIEFESLKESIRENGLWVPIIINNENVILDGHHRYNACIELKSKIYTNKKKFNTKLDEEIFVLECNAKRRQLDDLGKHKIYENLKPRYEKLAKQRMSEGGGDHKSDEVKNRVGANAPTRSSKEQENLRSSTQAGSQVNLSRKKAGRMDYVKEYDPNLYEQIGKTDKMTVNKAYTTCKKKEKQKERKKKIKETQVVLPESIILHNQDFATAPIKDNSISLIFTDPPYDEKSLHLYDDLGKQAFRVLKDGGSLVTYAGHFNIQHVIFEIEKHDLKFEWIFCIQHSGPSTRIHSKKIHVTWKPMLYFSKGKYGGGEINDSVKSEYQGKDLHKWAQSTIESDYYIKQMTIENEIVYDPFMGQGTFGISATKLNRQFIGCEVDKDHFENARRLISIARN